MNDENKTIWCIWLWSRSQMEFMTKEKNMIRGYKSYPYCLTSQVAMCGIYDYKPNHGCRHACYVLV